MSTRSQPRTDQQTAAEFEAILVVDNAQMVADGVVSLTLSTPNGEDLPRWRPGAHVDLILGEEQLVRQYSLCGSPTDRSSWRLGVLRTPESRGGSEAVHTRLKQGQLVRVRGPRNHFPLVAAPRYLFLAGGIGITPLLPMLAEVEAAGSGWRLVYGGRTRTSMAFTDELTRYRDKVELVPEDERGIIDLDVELGTPQPGTLVYCCGPTGFLDAIEKRCSAWPPGSLHLERFTARRSVDSRNTTFEVVLRRSGVTLIVPPDKSVFEVCTEAGVDVVGFCLDGLCGTCETDVIEGEVDHRDSLLSIEERASSDYMMICVSRCRSERLILDL